MENSLISIIVPIYNEESNIIPLYKRISKSLESYNYELLYINDGSIDHSESIVLNLLNSDNRVKIINFTRNFSHEAANSAGLKYAKGECVVIIDGDLQDPPELIPIFIEKWLNGSKVVYGARNSRSYEGFFKRYMGKLFYKVLNKYSDFVIPEDAGDFCLLDRQVVDDFNKSDNKCSFFRGLIFWMGYDYVGVPYERERRSNGKSKYNVTKLISLAFDSYISHAANVFYPLIGVGIILLFLSITLFLFFLINRELSFVINCVISLLVLFSGLNSICIGIAGEYFSRTYKESKKQPLYIVKDIKEK